MTSIDKRDKSPNNAFHPIIVRAIIGLVKYQEN
jgi:hypothetical protein